MNTTTSQLIDSTTIASSPASSLPAHVSASAETPTPPWTETYFTELDRSCNTAAAAQAAGVTLPVVIRLRRSDAAFAARESAALQAIPELLLAEALARTLRRAAAAETSATANRSSSSRSPAQPRFGSDALLVKLLRHYIPGFGGTPKAARSATRSTHPEPATSAASAPAPSQDCASANPIPAPCTSSPPPTTPTTPAAPPTHDRAKFLADRRVLLDEIHRLQKAGYAPEHPELLRVRIRLSELYAVVDPHRAKRAAQLAALTKSA